MVTTVELQPIIIAKLVREAKLAKTLTSNVYPGKIFDGIFHQCIDKR